MKWILLLLAVPHPLGPPRQQFDRLEVNHFYHLTADGRPKRSFVQLIAWDWHSNPSGGKFCCQAWTTARVQVHRVGPWWVCHFEDHKRRVDVVSRHLIETHTLHDPERDDRARFPERYRRGWVPICTP